jgi:hypothetical protein
VQEALAVSRSVDDLRREGVATATAEGPVTVVRGRCIDEAGQPIAGVIARLSRSMDPNRVSLWRPEHGEQKGVFHEVTTGADGVFALRLWPPPAFRYGLRLTVEGRTTGQHWFERLVPGVTEDLGDFELVPGTLVRGRVVDAEGAPVGQARVSVRASPTWSGPRIRYTWGTTRADGSFDAEHRLEPGDYVVAVGDNPIERPAKVALSGEPECFLDVVLKRIEAADVISGIVVDAEGVPVAGGRIGTLSVLQPNTSTFTDSEGRFRLLREKGAPSAVRLEFTALDCDPVTFEGEFAWGRSDLRLVVSRGKSVEVLVVYAADGSPIETYALRITPAGSREYASSRDFLVRGGTEHPGGRAVVESVRSGRHNVIVDPLDDQVAVGVARVEVTAERGASVTVQLAPAQRRVVRIQREDGTPIAGARVDLVDPLGARLEADTPVLVLSDLRWTNRQGALHLDAGETDEHGEVSLHAPTNREVGLLLPGPGHAPMAVPVAVWAGDGPLVVTVGDAGTLRGATVPPEAIAELARLAGAQELGGDLAPILTLSRRTSGKVVRFPHSGFCRLSTDGTFELEGVPSGRWDVTLQCRRNRASYTEQCGSVEVAEGVTTEHTIDLAHILPGQLDAVVFHNGAPLASETLSLSSAGGVGSGGAQRSYSDVVTTDTRGRFHATIRPGNYTVRWSIRDGVGPGMHATLVAPEPGIVVRGQTSQQTFTLQSGTFRLQLLSSDGAPAAGVGIELRAADRTHYLPNTDAAGRLDGVCEAASWTAWVLPKSLQDANARAEWRSQHQGEADPFASARLRLGDVTVRAGGETEVELRLPPEWER